MGSCQFLKDVGGGKIEVISSSGIKEIRKMDGTSDVAVDDILDAAFVSWLRNGKQSDPVPSHYPSTTLLTPQAVLKALQRDYDQRTGRGMFYQFPCDPVHPVFSEQGAGEILNESTLVDEYEQIKLRYCFQGVLDWMSALDRYGFFFSLVTSQDQTSAYWTPA